MEQKSVGGTPDIIGVVSGLFVAIETKTDHGQPTELQLLKLNCIQKAGGFASVMTPSTEDEEFRRLLQHVEKSRNRS